MKQSDISHLNPNPDMDEVFTMIHALKSTLSHLGILSPLKKARYELNEAKWKTKLKLKRVAMAYGLAKWKPLIPEQKYARICNQIIDELQQNGHKFGDHLEFGVSRGTSLATMRHSLKKANLGHIRSIGFDSFKGMPAGSEEEGWDKGAFASTESATKSYLEKQGVDLSNVHLVKGWFNETCNDDTIQKYGMNKASIVMIDCDIYSATCEVLNFIEPLLAETSVLIFDDWGWRSDINEIGQKEAFEEFIDKHPEFTASPRPTYLDQARIFLMKRAQQ